MGLSLIGLGAKLVEVGLTAPVAGVAGGAILVTVGFAIIGIGVFALTFLLPRINAGSIFNVFQSSFGDVDPGLHQWAVRYVDSRGTLMLTLFSNVVEFVFVGPLGTGGRAILENIPLPNVGVNRHFYRTAAGSTAFRVTSVCSATCTTVNNTETTLVDNLPDAFLGGPMPQ